MLTDLVATALGLSIPVMLAALGGVISESSGMIYIGLEGPMAIGACGAFIVDFYSKNAWLGIAGGLFAGLLLGLLVAYLEVIMSLDQILMGVALILLGPSLANYLADQTIAGSTTAVVPVLQLLPLNQIIRNSVGVILSQNLVTYGTLILGVVIWILLFRTHIGLRLRTVGEDPRVAGFMGVHIKKYHFVAVVIGTVLAALGGAFIIAALGAWEANLTAGRGFIAIAIMRIGGWKPQWVVLFSFIFGLAEAGNYVTQILSLGLPAGLSAALPYVSEALPYVLAIVVLVLASKYRRWAAPKSLGFA